ncbi:hypothetical protein RHGRI_000393 [Rhododendron griersonianum]|uniref:Uncharacterized protein n=1 Tax=Rhododendron griersonianum TaxID=479676 RepID=A0AAV6LIR9_9ERIC|nr:hypothetical protein RHGRI_000393 [Rhododendron griersonianum]
MATAFVYTYCITVVTPNVRQSASHAIVYLVMAWACMISLYLLKHTRQSIRSLKEERVNQKKNRERITWRRPQNQLSIKVVGWEDEADIDGWEDEAESADIIKEIKAGRSESDEAGGSEESGSNEDGESIIKFSRKRQPRPFPIEVGSKKIEAGGSESDEAGRSKEIEVGGSKSDEAGISKEIEVAVSDEIEADRSGFDETGITKEIEGGGSQEIEAVRSRSECPMKPT